MRRVSYTFPRTCDIAFEIAKPFPAVLDAVSKLAGRQDNFRTELGHVKRDFTVKLAANRTGFEVIAKGAQMSLLATDEADVVINIYDTVLSSSGHKPIANSDYLVKFLDQGGRTEVFVTGLNARGMQKILMELM
jgi:hypothetical protein